MRNLRCRFVYAAIMSVLIMFLVGCAIGVKPRAYDQPVEDDVYYEESVYGSYYNAVPRSNTYYHYDPNYDPWTMGTYYEHYSGPPRAAGSSGSSNTGGTRSENKRPAVEVRDSGSVNRSGAPSGERTSLKRDRSTIRKPKRTAPEPSNPSVTHQKVRKNVRREATQTSQKKQPANDSQAKQRRTRTETTSRKDRRDSAKQEKEEEDKDKKARQK